MSLERFFVEVSLPPVGAEVELSTDEARHLISVYRAAMGREVTLFDGGGFEVRARVVAAEKRLARLEILERIDVDPRPRLDLELAVALPRGGAADEVIKRALEVGASRIIPLEVSRSVHRVERKDEAKRRERFRRLAIASMKLSGRNSMPELESPQTLGSLSLEPGMQGIFGSTLAGAPLLSSVQWSQDNAVGIRLVIGPEGGFTAEELKTLRDLGYGDASFGPMVLRVQTAVVLGLGCLAMN